MTFDGSKISASPGASLSEDRYRSVELEVLYRQLTCAGCNFTSIYQYKIKQIRRKSEEEVQKGGRLTPEQRETWLSIPRYAEIPETLHCKKCGEVLGLYTNCIF